MPRVISVFLPNWPVERRRGKQADAPAPEAAALILSVRRGQRREVFAANRIAQAAGLRVGMAVTKAQALLPGLAIEDADPTGDHAGLERLALWALRLYSPIVAADPPDGLVIEASGAAHLHGGEDGMLRDMVDRLAKAGITVRAAISDTWGAAHAAARYLANPIVLVLTSESPHMLRQLPLAALRLPRHMVADLRRLGFQSIGDLVDAPRAPLALRFGLELHRRLDRATGRLAESIDPARPPELIAVEKNFAEPIGAAETLARYTGKLVDALCVALEAKGLGARRLDLLFHRVDSHCEAIRVGTATPVRDRKRLTRLLCDRLETIDPGFGVEMMSLRATLAEPFKQRQIRTSLLADEPEADVSAVIDILANRVGGDKIYRFAPVESDVPERSVRRVAPMAPMTAQGWPNHWPRPSRLLRRPEPIDTVALLPDHPPVSFTWAGSRRRVKRADGPERVFGEWWKRDAEFFSVRDYFRVEDEAGKKFWIFRAGDGEDKATGAQTWFMHGIFG